MNSSSSAASVGERNLQLQEVVDAQVRRVVGPVSHDDDSRPARSEQVLGASDGFIAEPVGLVGVGSEALVAIGFVVGEVALEPPHHGVVFEGQHVRGDAVQEPAIVANHDGAARETQQRVLQRAQRIDVQVVGRFVQQQNVPARCARPWPVALDCVRHQRFRRPSSVGRCP